MSGDGGVRSLRQQQIVDSEPAAKCKPRTWRDIKGCIVAVQHFTLMSRAAFYTAPFLEAAAELSVDFEPTLRHLTALFCRINLQARQLSFFFASKGKYDGF